MTRGQAAQPWQKTKKQELQGFLGINNLE